MLRFSGISLETKRAVARCAGALALIARFFFISLNNHGSIAYLTRSEHGFLYSLAFVAGVFFVVATVNHNATQPGNPRKP
jgi:hypothetical protein